MKKQTRIWIYASILIVAVMLIAISCSSKPEEPIVEPDRYGTITGYAYLEGTDKRLSNVIVTIDGRSDTTRTLIDGTVSRYKIDSVLVGKHTLTATRDEYHKFTVEVEVPEFLEYDIDLQIAIDVGNLRGFVWHPKDQYISSALVTVDGRSTYSKPDGSYELLNLPVGEHNITCNMFSYHPYENTVVISGSSNEFEIVLVKTFNDTIFISNDATVVRSSLNPEFINMNLGSERELSVLHSGGESGIVDNRIFIGLPALHPLVDISVVEYAYLVLTEASSGELSTDMMRDPPSIVVRRVLDSWSEMDITWITKPDVDTSEEFAVVDWNTQGTWLARIDIMKAYTDRLDPANGIALITRSDEQSRLVYETINFYSSEAGGASSKLKPYVVMRYTL